MSIPTFFQLLSSFFLRLTAYELGNIADNSTAMALMEALQDKAIGVRREAICALSKIDREQAIKVIWASLPYKDNFIVNIAASILSKSRKFQYIPHLWKALVQAEYIHQAKEINFHEATNNLYSAIEKIQQQHQLYNPELC
ncbi:MAG: HEAT repeat domain-containing protein [Rivularia sp. (in: cyanobacteria)]